MANSRKRIAVLIDADNAPAVKINVILREIAGYGDANVRRAFGNWKSSNLKQWEERLHAHAIRPIQQFAYSTGKNATDMAIVIDAMDLLHSGAVDAFALVSSDADFTPLALRLREGGATVYGFGEAKTPEPFVRACSVFTYADRLADIDTDLASPTIAQATAAASRGAAKKAVANKAPAKKAPAKKAVTKKAVTNETPSKKAPAKKAVAKGATAKKAVAKKAATPEQADRATLRSDTKLVALLRSAVSDAAGTNTWANFSAVGDRLSKTEGFDAADYGYKTLRSLMEASDLFVFENRNKVLFVRAR